MGTGGYIAICIVGILSVIAWWRIFSKAGESGWKAIIPFYNMYTMYKLFWKKIVFVIMLIICAISLVGAIMMSYGMAVSFYNYMYYGSTEGSGTMMVGILILAATGIAALVLQIIFYHKLSRAFGHGAGFTVGLIFLNVIFIMILAFGSSRYMGGNNEPALAGEDAGSYRYKEPGEM